VCAVPVIEISALPQPEAVDPAAALRAVTRAVAAALGEDERGTWATWRPVEPGRFVEGSDAPAVQPRSTHPPLVRVTAFEGRPDEEIARVLTAVADALAGALGLEPGNVFVRYDEATAGRLYTGGSLPG
jgi:phenylpyruvate tautomerase PptA (4-oxalocrotonate tautomerase family)